VTNSGDFPDQFGTVSILLANGDGTYRTGASRVVGRGTWAVVVGDFNDDGVQDLAVAGEGYYVFDPNFGYVLVPGTTVYILLGTGDGTFGAARSISVGLVPSALVVGDFNGDGKPDLAVAAGIGVSVLLGNGDGTFQPARNFPAGASPRSVAVGDFNGDG